MRRFQAFWLCLIIGTGSCANSPGPDRAANGGRATATARQQVEGVAGRITDEDGHAVEGASVLVEALDTGGPAIPEMVVVSDAEGRYQWPLRAGRYEVTVVADGYQRASKQVALEASEKATLDFVLSRSAVPIARRR